MHIGWSLSNGCSATREVAQAGRQAEQAHSISTITKTFSPDRAARCMHNVLECRHTSSCTCSDDVSDMTMTGVTWDLKNLDAVPVCC